MKYQKHLKEVERIFNETISHKKLRLHSSERDTLFETYIWKKFINSLNQNDLRYYPNLKELYKKIILYYKITKPYNVILGEGSDRIIKYVFECFCRKNSIVITTNPCFPMYIVYSKLYHGKIIAIPYKELNVDIDKIIKKINIKTSIVILSNPSSPVGDLISTDKLIKLSKVAKKYNTILVIDEAYIEFSSQKSFIIKMQKLKLNNVLVIKTFSKALGSAGARVGFGVSTNKNISIIKKFRSLYEISGFTNKWVKIILKYKFEVKEYINKVKKNKKIIINSLQNKYDIITSETNWIHINNKNDNIKLNNFQNIVIKSGCKLPNDKRTNWLRLSIPASTRSLKKIISYLK